MYSVEIASFAGIVFLLYLCIPVRKSPVFPEIEEDDEVFESIEDLWPDYPSKEDFLFNEDEY